MGGRGREGERERRRTKGEGGTKVEREGGSETIRSAKGVGD